MTDTLIDARVTAKTIEADGICSFTLHSVAAEVLPAFVAGAHVDVFLPTCTRQYSLCNDPNAADGYELGVLLDPATRGGSAAMHRLEVGDVIKISAPRCLFSLEASQQGPSLLLAGGIGITPLISMAYALAHKGQAFALHYCTRSAERTAFAERLRKAPFSEQVHFHHDDVQETRLDVDAVLAEQAPETHIYACGPAGFLDYVLKAAQAQGWPQERIHFERFAAPVASATSAFEVKLASTGQVFSVPPEVPISQVLLAEGVDVPLSCEQGVCGTCLTRVLEGTPEHYDAYLTDAERTCNDQMLICCSRAAPGTCLTLDL